MTLGDAAMDCTVFPGLWPAPALH